MGWGSLWEASPWNHHDFWWKDWLPFCQGVRTPLAITPALPTTPTSRQLNHPVDNIVIVGGGFAGLYTALALAGQKRHPPILLIEPQDRFLFLPLLYELLSGELRSWEIAPRYDDLLAGRGIAWLQDRVERIDPSEHRIHTRGGRTIGYSRLVLATGAVTNTFGVPGADQHAMGFRSLGDVERLHQLLQRMRKDRHPLQRLAIVGAGPTGVELACKLADLVGDCAVIELIEQGGTHLPQAKAFNREQALMALQRKDVRLRTHTRVMEVTPDGLTLRHTPQGLGSQDEEFLSAGGVIWTAGLQFLPPGMASLPPTSPDGRLICRQDLGLEADDHIFVAGDLAHLNAPENDNPSESRLPATAQVAFQQAPLLAMNLLRSLEGKPLEAFRWNDLGEMMSLGVGEACLCGSGLTLAGPAAYQLRRLAYLTRLPGLPHQMRVAAGWMADWTP